MDEVELQIHPRWKQAVRDFLAADFKPGDVIKHAWLEERFGLGPLADDQALTVQQHRERQFRWLQCMEPFKAELLEEHCICLSSVYGEGYRVTPPAEQTALATEHFEADARRAFRKAALRLKHVQLDALTETQRRENTDALAKLSMLRGMQRGALE